MIYVIKKEDTYLMKILICVALFIFLLESQVAAFHDKSKDIIIPAQHIDNKFLYGISFLQSKSSLPSKAKQKIDKYVSIKDFGAKGDGVTDDTKAIQDAINYAYRMKYSVYMPPTTPFYNVLGGIVLKSDVDIRGDMSKLYTPSCSEWKCIFSSGDNGRVNNVIIDGLEIISDNDRIGSGHEEGRFTSHVAAISVHGIENLTVKNTVIRNMSYGIILSGKKLGEQNKNVKISNTKIFNTSMCVLAGSTDSLSIVNCVFDGSGGGTHYLHNVYMTGNITNLKINSIKCLNASGGGLHLYSGKPGMLGVQNSTIKNVHIIGCYRGLYVWSEAKNIAINNLLIKNCANGISCRDVTKITFRNILINNIINTTGIQILLYNTSDALFDDIKIDASNLSYGTGIIFGVMHGIKNVIFNNIFVMNMRNQAFMYEPDSSIHNLIVKNSKFHWLEIDDCPISFQGKGATAIIENNSFINEGTEFNSLFSKPPDTTVKIKNNLYFGFKKIL